MSKVMKADSPNYWVIAMGLGVVGALGAGVYALLTKPEAGMLVVLFGAPAILGAGLLAYQGLRRRMLYTERGVAEINAALVKIAEGDLTVRVPEDNAATRDIAREIERAYSQYQDPFQGVQ